MAKPPKRPKNVDARGRTRAMRVMLGEEPNQIEGGGVVTEGARASLDAGTREGAAYRRQERYARGEYPVARVRTKGKKRYTNDAAHGDDIVFPPSEKTQRQRKIGY